MKNNRGFTLIEMILTLALIGIIITPIFSFFIRNVQVYKEEDTKIELSHHGQFALDYMRDTISESKNIVLLDGNIVNDNYINIRKIIFSDGINLYTFRISNKSLKFDNAEVANYVEKMEIKILPSSLNPSDYKQGIGIIINIYLHKDNTNYNLSEVIMFRNKN